MSARYPHLSGSFPTRSAIYEHLYVNGFRSVDRLKSLWRKYVWIDGKRYVRASFITRMPDRTYRVDTCIPYPDEGVVV